MANRVRSALCRFFGIQLRPASHLILEPGAILSDEQIEGRSEQGRG